MIDHEDIYKLFRPDLEHPTHDDFKEECQSGMNLLPVPWLEPRDISAAVAWLASDESRYVTRGGPADRCRGDGQGVTVGTRPDDRRR